VIVELPFKRAGRRDPSNYLPPVKAIVDGLVDAGLWPDDTGEFVTISEPALVVGSEMVVVRICPLVVEAERLVLHECTLCRAVTGAPFRKRPVDCSNCGGTKFRPVRARR